MRRSRPQIRRAAPRLAARAAAVWLALAAALPAPAAAVRPFVTDDARITDLGQIQLESWLEVSRPDAWLLAYNVFLSVSVTPWLEVGASGGIGLDSTPALALPSPSLQAKLLFRPPGPGPVPGAALYAGGTFPVGVGALREDAFGFFAIAPLTSELLPDQLTLHVNVGLVGAASGDLGFALRAYWGVGLEVALGHPDVRAIGEVFAGDPLVALGPRFSAQVGVRWLAREHVNLDLGVVLTPDDDAPGGVAWVAQAGLRLLLDVRREVRPAGGLFGRGRPAARHDG